MPRLASMVAWSVVAVSLVVVAAAAGRRGAACGLSGDGTMRYAWGNALDPKAADCLGPEGQRYPKNLINRFIDTTYTTQGSKSRESRVRKFEIQSPLLTREMLLQFHNQPAGVHHEMLNERRKRATQVTREETPASSDNQRKESKDDPIATNVANGSSANAEKKSATTPASSCVNNGNSATHGTPPARLCPTRYNTTAPMFGVSLTSGRTVTIVQKFPDLLQQVVFEVCESSECDILRGECVQTYVPYLFLVIPLGPVTLTGQDYVLVEAGCVCRPKYGVHVPQTLDAYFAPPLPTEAYAQQGNQSSAIKSLP